MNEREFARGLGVDGIRVVAIIEVDGVRKLLARHGSVYKIYWHNSRDSYWCYADSRTAVEHWAEKYRKLTGTAGLRRNFGKKEKARFALWLMAGKL